MNKPRALDLFCGAGGASHGLVMAGYDVTGVDIEHQKEYPYDFIQADALNVDLRGYDLIWSSPPCQHFSSATRDKGKHLDLIECTRARLRSSETPYIIENVMGAPLHHPVMLCGAMFDLGVIRHRIFETSFEVPKPIHPKHDGSIVTGEYVTVAGNGGVPSWTLGERVRRGLPRNIPGETALFRWRDAMGIQWMSRKTIVQAVPPAYSKWLGEVAIGRT